MYIHIYAHIYVCVQMCNYIDMYVYVYIYIYASVDAHTYLTKSIYTYTCYMYIHTYIHIKKVVDRACKDKLSFIRRPHCGEVRTFSA